ncbi:hypothetical protein GC173_09725 [bacterium]|nr:hypothetical protein [bacterium]
MKMKALVAGLAIATMAMVSTAHADRYTRATNDNPLRFVRYVVQPVGLLVEYVVYRPIHWVVSQPNLDIVFGHEAKTDEDGTYFEWTHGDYSPSIAAERPKSIQAPERPKSSLSAK